MNRQSSSRMSMPSILRALFLLVLASLFSAGCANTTRVTRYPANGRALSSDTLVVEQKVKEVDITKPGALGPFDNLFLSLLMGLAGRY
jgi:outer membrane murein-binding lipoprotein Lpp